MNSKTRKRIENQLAVKDYVEHENRIYFVSRNGYIVSLPKGYYFKRLHELKEYFRDREPEDSERLVLENLSIVATPLEEDLSEMKIEKVYESCFCTCWKISNHPESYDGMDIDPRPFHMREKIDPWNTARERENPEIMEYARKIRNWLRGDKD